LGRKLSSNDANFGTRFVKSGLVSTEIFSVLLFVECRLTARDLIGL
jgi:hypothetical protein